MSPLLLSTGVPALCARFQQASGLYWSRRPESAGWVLVRIVQVLTSALDLDFASFNERGGALLVVASRLTSPYVGGEPGSEGVPAALRGAEPPVVSGPGVMPAPCV